MKLSEHILLSKEERMSHCDLSSPCQFDQRKHRGLSRILFFEFAEVENDVGDLKSARIGVNHLCASDTNNGGCVNPLHIYIGTKSENSMDMSDEKRGSGGRACKGRKNTWTTQETCQAGAKVTSSQKWKSLIDGHVAPPGPLASRIRKQLGLKKGEKFDFKEHAVRLSQTAPDLDAA